MSEASTIWSELFVIKGRIAYLAISAFRAELKTHGLSMREEDFKRLEVLLLDAMRIRIEVEEP